MVENIFGILELLRKRYVNIEIPDQFLDYLKIQEENGHKIIRADNNLAIYDFFNNQQIPQDIISTFLTTDSRFITWFGF